MHVPREMEVVFKDKSDEKQETMKDKVTMSRQVYIKATDIEQFGMTRGCPRCDHQLRYGPGRTTSQHSQACRARIMGEIAKTPLGRVRIANASKRLDRTVAEMGEQHRIDVPQGEKLEDGVRQPDAVAEVLPQFIPLPTESRVVLPPADEPGKGETRVREVGDDVEHEFEGLGSPVEEEEAPACRDGQELPGMEIDVMHGNPTDVRSLVFAAPECDSPGVRGCQVDPIATSVSWTLRPEMKSDGCSGNPESEKGDLLVEVDQSQSNDDMTMRELMKLMNQAEAEETRELDREIMSIVKSLGGNSSKYRRERS